MMGICKSKPKEEEHVLNERQRNNIFKMVRKDKDGKVLPISQVTLRILWHHVFTEYLMNLIVGYLFKSSDHIGLDDLELFYYNMVVSSTENRATIIMFMIGTLEGIHPRIMYKYITNLIESYLLVMRKTNPEAYYTWLIGDEAHKRDLDALADYCMKDIYYLETGRIDKNELERWLILCSLTREMFESIFRHACNMDEEGELRPILPKADKYTTLLRIPQVLLLSHMTHSHTKRVWRQLYSSSTDAQAWAYLQLKILDQGPSLVIIEEVGGVLFGGFASQSWKIRNGFYGDEKCFLFRLRPDVLLCTSTGHNQHYQYLFDGVGMFPKGLGFGGFINYFGIYLSPDFGPGKVAETCLTFNDYVPLSNSKDFRFSRIEVWGIGDPDEKGSALWLEQNKRVIPPVIRAAMKLLEDTEDFEQAFRSPYDSESDD